MQRHVAACLGVSVISVNVQWLHLASSAVQLNSKFLQNVCRKLIPSPNNRTQMAASNQILRFHDWEYLIATCTNQGS